MKLSFQLVAALGLLVAQASAQGRRFVKQKRLRRPNQLSAAPKFQCDGEVQFELITGFVYSSADDIIESNIGALQIAECVNQCRNNDDCMALNFETGLCVLFRTASGEDSGERGLLPGKKTGGEFC